MPFDPALPAANSVISSTELRGQFNGLKQLIEDIPAGVSLEQFNDAIGNMDTMIISVVDSLGTEIAGTARNPVNVSPLNLTITHPPTPAEVQAIADKLDQLIGNLMRP